MKRSGKDNAPWKFNHYERKSRKPSRTMLGLVVLEHPNGFPPL